MRICIKEQLEKYLLDIALLKSHHDWMMEAVVSWEIHYAQQVVRRCP